MTDSHVPTGYELARDERGLTSNERAMKARLLDGATVAGAAREMGLTRQRGHQLVTALISKNAIVRKEGGGYARPDGE